MVGVKVPIGSSLDTKDDFHTRNGHAERGNLSVGPIDDTYNKTITLYLPRYYSRVREKGKLACDMAGGLIYMNIIF